MVDVQNNSKQILASLVAQWWRTHLQCSRCGIDPWVRKIPWRREWLPIPVFLPGEFHGQRSLVGYSPRGHKRVRHDWATKRAHIRMHHTHTHTHTHTHIFPLRDTKAAPVSTKKKKKIYSWLEDSTSAKDSFHCSTLLRNLMPLILGSVFLPQLHQASQFQCFLWQTGIGRPVSVFASTDHHTNEKYLHAAGSETHDFWLQCSKGCLQGCWLQLDIKPIISSLAVWT